MGNNHGHGQSQIDRQEKWVDEKFNNIKAQSSTKLTDKYTTRQIRGALRQEYYSRPAQSDDYVLSGDWKQMYPSSKKY